jgi:hypothetical protein
MCIFYRASQASLNVDGIFIMVQYLKRHNFVTIHTGTNRVVKSSGPGWRRITDSNADKKNELAALHPEKRCPCWWDRYHLRSLRPRMFFSFQHLTKARLGLASSRRPHARPKSQSVTLMTFGVLSQCWPSSVCSMMWLRMRPSSSNSNLNNPVNS